MAVALVALVAPAAASAETLRVVTNVMDGPAQPSDFTIHVSSSGEELASAPGSASGTDFVLEPGSYRVSRSGPGGYVRAFSGACDARGDVSLSADATCTLTLDHVPAPDDGCVDYPSFAQPAGLNLVGDAVVSQDVLHLNPQNGGVGAAWFGAGLSVGNGFTADFDFRITGGDGADGLAFVIQAAGLDELGESGGGIGYQGLQKSLAIELDTWGNGNEPDVNHVAVHSAGTGPNSAGPDALLGEAVAVGAIDDGEAHQVRVVYEPGTLEVFVDDITTPKLTLDVDLSDLLALDSGTALVGFTGATGGFAEGHRIERWSLCAEQQEPATLHVTTQVEGGVWLAEDFTVHVRNSGEEAPSSPQPGSAAGTDFTLGPGEYVVSAPARGYEATFSGDCEADGSIALAAGEGKTCTITNRDAPLGPGLVVESYEPSRTDSEWGLTESFLTDTRAYLEDPAIFGPEGTVPHAFQVAPGIRVANGRTLAGVDILFTGWVPSSSYTEGEKEALREFVLGGGTLIATTDDSGHTMVDAFGLTQGDGGGSPTYNTITQPAHPIARGPFGIVRDFHQYAATGHYPELGQHAAEVGRNDQGTSLAVIGRDGLAAGSGAAVFVADVDVFSNHGGAASNERLIKNLFAFAAAPAVTVNAFEDGDGECTPDHCTLREAVERSPSDAVIQLSEGEYSLDPELGSLVLGGRRHIQGAGADVTKILGGRPGRVFTVLADSPSIADVTIAVGDPAQEEIDPGLGGGIYVSVEAALSLARTAVRANKAEDGGGIYSEGRLFVEDSLVAFNDVGGGIAVAAGTASIANTTISANTGSALFTSSRVTLENVTIAHNGDGAALRQAFDGDQDLTTTRNTLIAGNEVNCAGTEDDLIDSHFSMADDTTCRGIAVESEAGLHDLGDYGGPFESVALALDSPALDRGDGCEATDQRGLPRPQGAGCDIGAYEAARVVPVNTPTDEDGMCTDAGCSLREAAAFAAPRALVTLGDGTFRLARGALVLRRSIDIEGSGARETTLAGTESTPVLVVERGETAVQDVLITGGDGDAGGGAFVDEGGELHLFRSAVEGNRARVGGGVYSVGRLEVRSSTIAHNEATDAEGDGRGGGLAVAEDTQITNSTISDNTASHAGGGIASLGGELELTHVTLAENAVGPLGGGGSALHLAPSTVRLRNTVIARHAAGACAGASPVDAVGVVTDDSGCPGQIVADVRLGDLDSHGPTDTHPLLDGSPAIDSGDPAFCAEVDQNGVSREHLAPCDTGAVEWGTLATAVLRVATVVLNDSGGTAAASDFNVHVRSGGADVGGSPRAGSADYTLRPGTYTVTGDVGARRYTVAYGDRCAADGTVALGDGDDARCVVTFDDIATSSGGQQPPPPPPPDDEELPPPEAGEEVNAVPKSGTVRVKVAGTNRFVELEEGQQIPVGSVVDTTKGRVTIVAAGNQMADFYSGIFRLTQGKGARPLTTLTLVEAISCPKAGSAIAAAKKKKRRLWGDGSGKFQTKGKHSAATVVGTKWLVEDRCTSTLTKVTRGKVRVRDFVKRKNVVVRAGKQYVARAKN